MYNQITRNISNVDYKTNEPFQGTRIEATIERMMAGKEPIVKDTNLYFTEEQEGVRPEYDIRTDRFDEMLDTIEKSHKAIETAEKKALEGEQPETTEN